MTSIDSPLSETQRRGRTFFICALLLLATMLFEPIVKSLVSVDHNFENSIVSSIIFILGFTAAFRGGYLSLKIIKGCLGFVAVLAALVIILGAIAIAVGKASPPRITWGRHTLTDFLSLAPFIYVYWALFFSESVKEFIIYQRAYFHAREMRKIQESIGRTVKGVAEARHEPSDYTQC